MSELSLAQLAETVKDLAERVEKLEKHVFPPPTGPDHAKSARKISALTNRTDRA